MLFMVSLELEFLVLPSIMSIVVLIMSFMVPSFMSFVFSLSCMCVCVCERERERERDQTVKLLFLSKACMLAEKMKGSERENWKLGEDVYRKWNVVRDTCQ